MQRTSHSSIPSVLPVEQGTRWWLSDLVLQEDPAEILAPYFLAVDAAVTALGINLSFVSPVELLEVNNANSECWSPLVPMFDHRFNLLTGNNFIGIVGRDRSGRVVSANAIRLYDWQATDFVKETQSLRLMYADPTGMKRPAESCSVTATNACEITGRAAFSGAAWVHPTHRRRGIGEVLPVLIKALAIGRWPVDCVFGMMAQSVYDRGFAARFGFEREEFEAQWKNSVHGDLTLAVLWASPTFITAGLTVFLGSASSEVNQPVLGRRSE